MDLKELTDLIQIRTYIENQTANFTIDRATVKEMNNLLLLINKKIIDILLCDRFKQYIGYNDLENVIKKAAEISNIKFGMNKKG